MAARSRPMRLGRHRQQRGQRGHLVDRIERRMARRERGQPFRHSPGRCQRQPRRSPRAAACSAPAPRGRARHPGRPARRPPAAAPARRAPHRSRRPAPVRRRAPVRRPTAGCVRCAWRPSRGRCGQIRPAPPPRSRRACSRRSRRRLVLRFERAEGQRALRPAAPPVRSIARRRPRAQRESARALPAIAPASRFRKRRPVLPEAR